jgi:hypothetical protein
MADSSRRSLEQSEWLHLKCGTSALFSLSVETGGKMQGLIAQLLVMFACEIQ